MAKVGLQIERHTKGIVEDKGYVVFEQIVYHESNKIMYDKESGIIKLTQPGNYYFDWNIEVVQENTKAKFTLKNIDKDLVLIDSYEIMGTVEGSTIITVSEETKISLVNNSNKTVKYLDKKINARLVILELLEVKGPTGDKGEIGETGERGDTGDKGDKGNTGDKGDKGDSFTSYIIATRTSMEEVLTMASIFIPIDNIIYKKNISALSEYYRHIPCLILSNLEDGIYKMSLSLNFLSKIPDYFSLNCVVLDIPNDAIVFNEQFFLDRIDGTCQYVKHSLVEIAGSGEYCLYLMLISNHIYVRIYNMELLLQGVGSISNT